MRWPPLRGAKAKAPKQNTHAQVPAAAAAACRERTQEWGNGGAEEAQAGSRGCSINTLDPHCLQAEGDSRLQLGRRNCSGAARAGLSRAFLEARAVWRCRSPHPDLCVSVCVCIVCVCVYVRALAGAAPEPRARTLACFWQCTLYTRCALAATPRKGGWGKASLTESLLVNLFVFYFALLLLLLIQKSLELADYDA